MIGKYIKSFQIIQVDRRIVMVTQPALTSLYDFFS